MKRIIETYLFFSQKYWERCCWNKKDSIPKYQYQNVAFLNVVLTKYKKKTSTKTSRNVIIKENKRKSWNTVWINFAQHVSEERRPSLSDVEKMCCHLEHRSNFLEILLLTWQHVLFVLNEDVFLFESVKCIYMLHWKVKIWG